MTFCFWAIANIYSLWWPLRSTTTTTTTTTPWKGSFSSSGKTRQGQNRAEQNTAEQSPRAIEP